MINRKAEAEARGVSLGGIAAAGLRIFTAADILIKLRNTVIFDGSSILERGDEGYE